MNSNTIARPSNALWLRRGIAVMGTLLISGTIAFGMASRAPLKVAPAAAPAASAPSARERFVAFKEEQATRVMDAAMGDVGISGVPVVNEWIAALKDLQMELHDAIFVPAPTQDAGRERYVELKDAQAEAHDATFVPAPVQDGGRARYVELKDTQAEARDATFVPMPVQDAGRERYAELKDAQAEAHDATFVPVPAQDSGRTRFAELKQRQAELREQGR
jgi:hypothetical protein